MSIASIDWLMQIQQRCPVKELSLFLSRFSEHAERPQAAAGLVYFPAYCNTPENNGIPQDVTAPRWLALPGTRCKSGVTQTGRNKRGIQPVSPRDIFARTSRRICFRAAGAREMCDEWRQCAAMHDGTAGATTQALQPTRITICRIRHARLVRWLLRCSLVSRQCLSEHAL